MNEFGAPMTLESLNCQIKEPVLDKLRTYQKEIWSGSEEDNTAMRNFKNLENLDKDLLHHDQHLSTHIQDLLALNVTENDYEKMRLVNTHPTRAKQKNKLILNEVVLCPLLDAQDEMSNLMRQENDKLKIDIVNLCSMLETVLNDNQKLRNYVVEKTEDFKKILSLTSENDVDQVKGLKDELENIKYENRML